MELTEFSDEIGLLEIEPYIEQKTSEKERLDKEICEKEERVHSLRHKVKELEERWDRTSEEQEKAGNDFRLFA